MWSSRCILVRLLAKNILSQWFQYWTVDFKIWVCRLNWGSGRREWYCHNLSMDYLDRQAQTINGRFSFLSASFLSIFSQPSTASLSIETSLLNTFLSWIACMRRRFEVALVAGNSLMVLCWWSLGLWLLQWRCWQTTTNLSHWKRVADLENG